MFTMLLYRNFLSRLQIHAILLFLLDSVISCIFTSPPTRISSKINKRIVGKFSYVPRKKNFHTQIRGKNKLHFGAENFFNKREKFYDGKLERVFFFAHDKSSHVKINVCM